MIDGVSIKKLITHADERGFFRELIRTTDAFFNPGFGQLSHSLVNPQVVKAWHGHTKQYQWTYVISGVLAVTIHDIRQDSLTYRQKLHLVLGDGQDAQVYVIPPGVVHGYQCITGPAQVLYVTSGTFDIEEEIRIPIEKLSF